MADRLALVTDAHVTTGLTTIRSLGRAGWRVIATSDHPPPPWARSRHAERYLEIASPERNPDRSADDLVAIASRHRPDLIMPTTDKSLIILDQHRDRFPRSTLATASPTALRVAWDKIATAELAAGLGIPVPRSAAVTSPQAALDAAATLGWPVVVKPQHSHQFDERGLLATRSVTVADNPDELLRQLSDEHSGPFPVQLQEFLTGAGVGVEVLACGGEVTVSFQHRRLHEVPLAGGMSAYRRAEEPDPQLLEWTEALMRDLSWDGLAMVEFLETAAGPRLLEINGRLWGSVALPFHAGVDFPALWAAQLNGTESPDPTIVVGATSRNLELELRWLLAALDHRLRVRRPDDLVPRGSILRTTAALVDPRTQFDLQDRQDWRPSLYDVGVSLTQSARAAGGAIAQRAGRRSN